MDKDKIKNDITYWFNSLEEYEFSYDIKNYIVSEITLELGYFGTYQANLRDIKVALQKLPLEAEANEFNLFLNGILHLLLVCKNKLLKLVHNGDIKPVTADFSYKGQDINLFISAEDIINQYKEKISCLDEFNYWLKENIIVDKITTEADSDSKFTTKQQILLLDLLGVFDKIKSIDKKKQSELLSPLIGKHDQNIRDCLTYFHHRTANNQSENPLFDPNNVVKLIKLLDELKLEDLSKEAKDRFRVSLEKKHIKE